MIKIRQVLAARVVRQVSAGQLGELRSDTVKKLQERYKFLKVPTTYEELFPTDPNQGIKFEQGTFTPEDGKTPIIVELFQLLPNLILVQTKDSTDSAAAFLEDYVQNANRSHPDTIRLFGPPLYGSELEFLWDKTVDRCAPLMTATAQRLDSLVTSYGSQVSRYRIASIVVNFNGLGLDGVVPAHFSVEWRTGIPDAEKLFFSLAPVRTSDHIALLETLDRDMHG